MGRGPGEGQRHTPAFEQVPAPHPDPLPASGDRVEVHLVPVFTNKRDEQRPPIRVYQARETMLAPRLNEGCPLASTSRAKARAEGRATVTRFEAAHPGRCEPGPISRYPARWRGSDGRVFLVSVRWLSEPRALFV